MIEPERQWAVNYEGGKIVDHALNSPMCKGYSNIQIAMDAPFLGRVADTQTRRSAIGMRAETAFAEYDETRMIAMLDRALGAIHDTVTTADASSDDALYIFQIARGKAAVSTEQDVLLPILNRLSIKQYSVSYGYRSSTYFQYPKQSFWFVNIGMMACLDKSQRPGELCIPETTHDIELCNDTMMVTKSRSHNDDVLARSDFMPVHLFGIADDMPFVTPQNYPNGAEAFRRLEHTVNL